MDHLPHIGAGTSCRETFGAVECSSKEIFSHRLQETPDFYNFANGQYGYIINSETKELVSNRKQLEENSPPLKWKANDFVQSWLYFELLSELFWDIDGFKRSNFTDEDLYITTKSLPELLDKWKDKISDADDQLDRIIRAQDVLVQARYYAYQFLSARNEAGYGQGVSVTWSMVKPEVACTILVLGETLTDALNKIQRSIGFKLRGWCNQLEDIAGWGYSVKVLELFEKAGWSSTSIQLLQKRFKGSTIALIHALDLRHPKKIRNEDDANYKPWHWCKNHEECPLIGVDSYTDVIKIIEDGHIPLFMYDTDKRKLLVKGTPVESPESYIVFSHVWADGFGNPGHNKLPRCVLQRISPFGPKGQPCIDWETMEHRRGISEPFWIDTLAIPARDRQDKYPSARAKAMDMIHDIYAKARHTLVLDLELLDTNKGPAFTPAALGISLSNWGQRLWTLHEAALSKKIYFIFKNRSCSLKNLEDGYMSERLILSSPAPDIAHAYYDMILGSEKHNFSGVVPDEHKKGLVGRVWKAVQWRTTKHFHHETLSLATLFKLETSEFVDASNRVGNVIDRETQRVLDGHMQHFLEMLHEKGFPIPVEMMFLPGPYLPDQGYRWAPRSWLSHQRVEHPDMYRMRGPSARLITNKGLEVSLPGIRLHGLDSNCMQLRAMHGLRFTTDGFLHDWYLIEKTKPEDSWFRMHDLGKFGFAIIYLEDPALRHRNIAVLVTIDKEVADWLEVRILSRVWIRREDSQSQLENCKVEFRKSGTRPLCYGEKLLDNQKWLVDGVDNSEHPPPKIPPSPKDESLQAVKGAESNHSLQQPKKPSIFGRLKRFFRPEKSPGI